VIRKYLGGPRMISKTKLVIRRYMYEFDIKAKHQVRTGKETTLHGYYYKAMVALLVTTHPKRALRLITMGFFE